MRDAVWQSGLHRSAGLSQGSRSPVGRLSLAAAGKSA